MPSGRNPFGSWITSGNGLAVSAASEPPTSAAPTAASAARKDAIRSMRTPPLFDYLKSTSPTLARIRLEGRARSRPFRPFVLAAQPSAFDAERPSGGVVRLVRLGDGVRRVDEHLHRVLPVSVTRAPRVRRDRALAPPASCEIVRCAPTCAPSTTKRTATFAAPA